MNQEILANFGTAVHELFIRWDALKLAVEHMGGQNGQQTAREIKDYVFKYCTQNENVHVSELIEILNEIMDDEFNTICEDNSVNDLSNALVGFLGLCLNGKFDEVRQRLSTLLPCVNWLDPSFELPSLSNGIDDSDSYSESESDDSMNTNTDNEAPNLVPLNQRPQRNRPQTDEDGWTTIPSRRRQ